METMDTHFIQASSAMKTQFLTTLLLLLGFLSMTSCHPGRHEEMQRQLETLSLHNQQDSVLTDDSLAQALADWFDDHGKPNEQVLAHYLLGRTHADRGEAPAAIAAYHDVIDRADTTAQDCDYGQLCRVYAQMAKIFYQQNLLEEHLLCLNRSIVYAKHAGDTLSALNAYAHKMFYFERIHEPDSVISLSDYMAETFMRLGYKAMAAQCRGAAVKSFVEKGYYDKASDAVKEYEENSGLFDADGNIAEGREAYYSAKGYYYLAVKNYTQAEYFFRKELKEGRDYNNQNMGSKGLALLFLKTSRPDSAAKYALYSYDMNDSVFAQMVTQDVENAHELYNYTRHLNLAKKERARAENARAKMKFLSSALLIIVAMVAAVFYWSLRKKRMAEKRHQEMISQLVKEQSEVLRLRSYSDSLEVIINQKNSDISQKKLELEEFLQKKAVLDNQLEEKEEKIRILQEEVKRKNTKKSESKPIIKNQLFENSSYNMLMKKATVGKTLSDEEWAEVERLVLDVMPAFNEFIMQRKHALNDIQYHTCILLRFDISQAAIGSMMNVSAPYISQVCKSILKKLFDAEGTGSELQKRLREI